MAIPLIGSVQSLFAGQGAIAFFDPITDANYGTATLAAFVNPMNPGQIVEDSFEYTGDELSTDDVKDMQGNIIISIVTAGTIKFGMRCANTNDDILKRFMQAETLPKTATNPLWSSVDSVIGTAGSSGVTTCPFAFFNQSMNKTVILPKAQIAASWTWSDNILELSFDITAENIDTENLKTLMVISGQVAA